MLEGENGIPSVPPTALINDYVTGYMGAAGATAALIRRAKEGGSYHVTVSLTRNAMWYQSLGLIPPEERTFAENPFRHLDQTTNPSLCHQFHIVPFDYMRPVPRRTIIAPWDLSRSVRLEATGSRSRRGSVSR